MDESFAALQQLKLIDVSGCRTAWCSFDRLERILGFFFGEAVTSLTFIAQATRLEEAYLIRWGKMVELQPRYLYLPMLFSDQVGWRRLPSAENHIRSPVVRRLN